MAVFTPLTLEEARQLLAPYPIGEVQTITGITNGVENTNYAVDSESGRYILTLIERRLTQNDIPFFLDLLDRLQQAGIPCPRAIRPTSGPLVPLAKNKPLMLVSYLPGQEVAEPSPQHLLSLGRMNAKLHAATHGLDIFKPNTVGLASWQSMLQKAGSDLNEIAPGLMQQLAEEYAWLAEHWPQDVPGGLVHADLFPDNVFFQTIHVSGIIDFYFTCTAPWLYDFATTFNAWCFRKEGKGQWKLQYDLAKALWRGYREHRSTLELPITEAELRHFPLFCRASALRFLLTRAMAYLYPEEGAQVVTKDPLEYWQKLQFHRQQPSAASYGFHLD